MARSTRAAVCRGDHLIHVYSLVTGEPLALLEFHRRSAVASAFVPGRRDMLLSVCRSGSFVAWRIAPGAPSAGMTGVG
jgi:hypothetical protein